MADVNTNSLLGDFFADINSIKNFVSDFAPVDRYQQIANNYTSYDANQLQNAIKALDTDLKNFDTNGQLSNKLKNQYFGVSGQLFQNDTGTANTTYPNVINASTQQTGSKLKDFAGVDSTNVKIGLTDETVYNTSTDYLKNVFDDEVKDTEATITEQEFNDKYLNKPFVMPSAVQEKIDEQEIINKRDDAVAMIATQGYENLKKAEGTLTNEQKKQRVLDLTNELKEAIGFDEKVDPNLLLLKVDVLNARSDRKKPLPRMLDIFAQAAAPTTEFFIQEKRAKDKDLKDIGLTAFGLVKDEEDEKKRMFQPSNNLTSIQMLDYNKDGKLTGELQFFKNTLTNAEANFYSNIKYPKTIGGVPTPEELVGKPIFTVTAPGLATDKPATSGLLGNNDAAVAEMLEQANFLEQGIQGELTILDIGRLNEQAGKKVYGLPYNISMFQTTAAGVLSDVANVLGQATGFEFDTSKFTKGMSQLDKEVEAARQLGLNVNPDDFISDIDNAYKNARDNINQSTMSDADKNESIALLSGYYSEFQNDVLTKNLNLLKIIEAQRTFSFARYLQGSNRLLKDVISDSRSVVKVGGAGNYHEKVIDRAEGMLKFYIRNYNDMIRPFYNNEDYETYKKTLTKDPKTGRLTVLGGVYQKEQISDAFGSNEASKVNTMSTIDAINEYMGDDNFAQDQGLVP